MADKHSQTAYLAATERQKAVEDLYLQNFGFINGLALNDTAMTFMDGGAIAEGIARHLIDYSDELTDGAFQAWATDIILPVLAFHEIHRSSVSYVKSAIWKILGSCTDLGVTSDTLHEAEQNVWLWCWAHLDSLRDPKAKAKPSTRLYEVARFAALTVRKTLLRTRERFGGTPDLQRLGCDDAGCLVIEPEFESEYDRHGYYESAA